MIEDINSPKFQETKEILKKLLVKIKNEKDPEILKKIQSEFKEVLADATPMMIATAEQELVSQDGFLQEDLVSACDIHMELFKDSIENVDLDVPKGHPIELFLQDHKIILDIMDKLVKIIREAKKKSNWDEAKSEVEIIIDLIDKLLKSENHNVRQENTLFPMLEKHGLEQPPAIMWMEHTNMKKDKKNMKKIMTDYLSKDYKQTISQLESSAILLLEDFAAHTKKEQHILYKAALDIITEEEWNDIKEECDNLGYFKDAI